MRRSSLFGHTAELLDQILTTRHPADTLVREFYRARHYLGSRDRRFISDTVFGILRHHDRLALLLSETLDTVRPGVRPARLPAIGFCAAYALRVTGETRDTLLPDVAGLWRTETADIDPAVLLDALADVKLPEEILSDPVRRIAIEYSVPEFIVREWVSRFGAGEAEALCAASNAQAPTTLRVNRLRADRETCLQTLAAEGVGARHGTLAPDALVLEKRSNLHSLRAFREGWFEVQDEGSQLIGLLVGPAPGMRIVDACAGGGGKTLHLAAMMENRGAILCLDSSQDRLKNLNSRLHRAGVLIADVHAMPPGGEDFPSWEAAADAVLVDSPCSGTGTFRRNPGSKITVTDPLVQSLQVAQRGILRRAARFTRPGGRLIYSTCSLLSGENEEIVDGFLSEKKDFHLVSAPLLLRSAGVPIDGEGSTLTLLPHRHSTDGYFAAVMERSDER